MKTINIYNDDIVIFAKLKKVCDCSIITNINYNLMCYEFIAGHLKNTTFCAGWLNIYLIYIYFISTVLQL